MMLKRMEQIPLTRYETQPDMSLLLSANAQRKIPSMRYITAMILVNKIKLVKTCVAMQMPKAS
jgi:hypothetical protein